MESRIFLPSHQAPPFSDCVYFQEHLGCPQHMACFLFFFLFLFLFCPYSKSCCTTRVFQLLVILSQLWGDSTGIVLHFRMLSNSPHFYPLDTSSNTPLIQVCQSKLSLDVVKCLQIPLAENHCTAVRRMHCHPIFPTLIPPNTNFLSYLDLIHHVYENAFYKRQY